MTLSTILVNRMYEAKFCARWDAINKARYANDLETAVLARDVRDVFVKGSDGDALFLHFVKVKFRNCRPRILLEMAFSFDHFDEGDYYRFGGWRGVRLLEKLTQTERNVVLPMMQGPGPYSYAAILARLHEKGIKPPHHRLGRPTREVQENNTRILRDYLMEILAKHPEIHPTTKVLAAMTKHQRDTINVVHERPRLRAA